MENKKAKNTDEATLVEEKYEGKPHGWVQWKGTNVCMDIYCKCGHHSHIDAEFAYHVKCPKCLTIYACNGHIELIELEEEPPTCVVMDDDIEMDINEFWQETYKNVENSHVEQKNLGFGRNDRWSRWNWLRPR